MSSQGLLRAEMCTGDMGFQKKLPAGTYYLGDPSHVLSVDHYDQLNRQMFKKRAMVKSEGYFPMEGHALGVTLASTVDGDGSFDDSDGQFYGVDAGMIGIAPEALVEPDMKKASKKKGRGGGLGRWETFKKPVTVRASKTKLSIASGKVITISLQQRDDVL